MNINLDNYEQYLLMYVDNELSAAERMQVETFLRDYPYLAEELEILQQTVLPLENILFDKSSLLKPVPDEKMQEKLLMHLDGELPAGESLALQNDLKADKMLRKEWDILQKTKLDAADIIEYPGKEALYRKEKTRIITFVRWAAAAILAGAGLFAGFKLVNSERTGRIDVATNVPSGKNNNETGIKDNNNNTAIISPEKTGEKQDVKDEGQDKKIPEINERERSMKNNMLATTGNNENKKQGRDKTNPVSPGKHNNTTPDVAVNDPQPVDKKQIADPKELPQRNIDNALRRDNDIAAVEKIRNNNTIELPADINTSSRPLADKLLTEKSNSYARTASLAFDEKNQDQILMMEEENVSRSKAAIFLKKLKRNVERRTNIKPGKSLRIAGFEFAVK